MHVLLLDGRVIQVYRVASGKLASTATGARRFASMEELVAAARATKPAQAPAPASPGSGEPPAR